MVRTLLARLPEDLQHKSIRLRLAEAWVLALNGQGDALDRILRGIETQPADAATEGFAPEMRAIRLTLAYVQDDSDRMGKLLRDARAIRAELQPWVADVVTCGAILDHLWHRRYAEARDF